MGESFGASENAAGDATLDARDDAVDGRPATGNKEDDGRTEVEGFWKACGTPLTAW
jgi:hypothetical protein